MRPGAWFEDWHVATLRNEQTNWLLRALFAEVLVEALSQAAGMRTHNPVGRGIIVGRTVEECLANIQFIDLVGAPPQEKVRNIDQETAKAGRFYEAGARNAALYQAPAGVAS